jgi:hypothetical protein
VSDAKTIEALGNVFANLGAPPAQARIMAAQLLKRARQVAVESGVTEVAAMQDLLAKVAAGRSGDYTGAPGDPGANGLR